MTRSSTLPLDYWGFDRWPFRGNSASELFYPTAGSSEALARIEYLTDSHRRLGVLLGESGLGKTLLLQVASQRFTRQGRSVVTVNALGSTTRELLWHIAAGLAASPSDEAEVPHLWKQIADRVDENRWQQIDTLLFVDDAGHAGPDMITQLTRLARLDPTPAARWTMVLVAEPGQVDRWSQSLRELVDLRIDFAPWSEAESVGFVQTSLVDAGRLEPVFDECALARLHELAEGVPRNLIRLADYALLVGAATDLQTIDRAAIDAAHEEIAWPTLTTVSY